MNNIYMLVFTISFLDKFTKAVPKLRAFYSVLFVYYRKSKKIGRNI